MKKLTTVFIAVTITLSLAGCYGGNSSSETGTNSYVESDDETVNDSRSGMGMTYNGKLGYDVGGGQVIPYDLSTGPQFGFTF